MIDYEKLKLVHEFADKNLFYISTSITSGDDGDRYCKFLATLLPNDNDNYCFDSIDDLIAKLRELTQPEEPKAKYAVGDEVFFVGFEQQIIQDKISRIQKMTDGSFLFIFDYSPTQNESQIYPTKQELIEAQIEYWHELAAEWGIPLICGTNEKSTQDDDMSPVLTECDHSWQSGTNIINGNYSESIYPHSCWRCGIKFDSTIHGPKCHSDTEECQHESDGNYYSSWNPDVVDGIIWKCKKCGDFYR